MEVRAEAGLGSGFVKAAIKQKGDVVRDTSYRGGHTAPTDPEYHSPLHEMNKQTYPDDIYSPQGARLERCT